jgi:ABC-2 type transport system permease protein
MNYIRLMVWKEFMQIKADPMMIRLILFPIFVLTFVMGYAITTEVRNTAVVVLDRSNSPQSVALVQSIMHSPLFHYVGACASEDDARAALDKGKATLALFIPADFDARLRLPGGATLGLLIDGQDANSSNVSAGYINAVILQWSVGYLRSTFAAKGIRLENVIPIDVRETILYNPMLKSSWYMIPCLAVVLVTIITALLTGFSIVKEKESGTLEQVLVTPIHPVHIVIGKVVPFVVIGLFELSAVMLVAMLWFRIPFRGNFLTVLLFGFIYMFSSLGIGILISTIARTPQQVLFFLWFLLIFFLFLSGFFLPLENMPGWVQQVTYINPLRYFMFSIREMFLKGSGMAELWDQALAMLAVGVVVFGAALMTFSRKVG